MAVWNPVLGLREIPDPGYMSRTYDCFGIGYHQQSSKHYKVVSFECDPPERRGEESFHYVKEVFLFDFNLNIWRKSRIPPMAYKLIDWSSGVSVGGDMYWVSSDPKGNRIICFDFTLEIFRDVCDFPPSIPHGILAAHRKDGKDGKDRKDGLSILFQKEESTEMELWVTKQLRGEVLLTRLLIVSSPPDLPNLHQQMNIALPVYTAREANIVVLCEEYVNEAMEDTKQIVLYELTRHVTRRRIVKVLNIEDQSQRTYHCGYKFHPSLVSLP